MTDRDVVSSLLKGQISHLSYVVPDLERAATWWYETFGAGPFISLPDIHFDRLDSPYEPVVWRHSSACGQWGQVALELEQIDEASPAEFAERVGLGNVGITHVSYIVDDPDQVSAALEREGMPLFAHGVQGPIEVFIHHAPQLGHGIELHRNGEMVVDFFDSLRTLSTSWDGSELLRPLPES
jgi:catechol 2,3-dioxygenase-like lactoylglutathione lyase family enzyme